MRPIIMSSHYVQQQQQISKVKQFFSQQLEQQLGLIEVQAPILAKVGDGIQDNLSGHENAVAVNVKAISDSSYKLCTRLLNGNVKRSLLMVLKLEKVFIHK